MSEDGLTTDPRLEMNNLLEVIDNLEDDITLARAESKVAAKKYERYARRYPEIAKALKAERGEGSAAEESAAAVEPPKKAKVQV